MSNISIQHSSRHINFSDIWNQLSFSQKNILFKLGQSGWRFDYTSFDLATSLATIIHHNGAMGKVNALGEVEFL